MKTIKKIGLFGVFLVGGILAMQVIVVAHASKQLISYPEVYTNGPILELANKAFSDSITGPITNVTFYSSEYVEVKGTKGWSKHHAGKYVSRKHAR